MKNILKNLIALLIGVFISIFIAELFLNWYNPFGFRQKGNKIVLPINTELIFKNETISGLDSIIKHKKNELGFRGAEKPIDFKNWTSIIAIGGSTTECFYISEGKDWVSLLGNKLNNEFKKIWVNNAGLDGHSTFGHRILLEDYLIKLKPNYIIFLIGCNDVGREDLNRLDKEILIATKNKNTNWKGYLANNSELVSLIVNLRRNYKAKERKLGHSAVMFQDLGVVDSLDQDKILQLVKHHQTFTSAFENRLTDLLKTTKNNNIIPILVTQPTLVGKGFDEHTRIDLEKVQYCDDLGGKAYWEKLEVYNDVTRKVAKNGNVFLIDLAEKMPKSTKLFYDCVHFTNEGAKTVSQIIYDEMREILMK